MRERWRQRRAGGWTPNATSQEAIHALGGTTIHVLRPDPSRLRSSHESEDFSFECDEEVRNDGALEDLYERVWAVVE